MKISWLPRAVASLDNQIEYIAQQSPKSALMLGDRIRAAIESLRSHPLLARPGRVEGTRELVVTGTPFVVVYRVRDEAIVILRILHGKQRWPPEQTR